MKRGSRVRMVRLRVFLDCLEIGVLWVIEEIVGNWGILGILDRRVC